MKKLSPSWVQESLAQASPRWQRKRPPPPPLFSSLSSTQPSRSGRWQRGWRGTGGSVRRCLHTLPTAYLGRRSKSYSRRPLEKLSPWNISIQMHISAGFDIHNTLPCIVHPIIYNMRRRSSVMAYTAARRSSERKPSASCLCCADLPPICRLASFVFLSPLVLWPIRGTLYLLSPSPQSANLG